MYNFTLSPKRPSCCFGLADTATLSSAQKLKEMAKDFCPPCFVRVIGLHSKVRESSWRKAWICDEEDRVSWWRDDTELQSFVQPNNSGGTARPSIMMCGVLQVIVSWFLLSCLLLPSTLLLLKCLHHCVYLIIHDGSVAEFKRWWLTMTNDD